MNIVKMAWNFPTLRRYVHSCSGLAAHEQWPITQVRKCLVVNRQRATGLKHDDTRLAIAILVSAMCLQKLATSSHCRSSSCCLWLGYALGAQRAYGTHVWACSVLYCSEA